MLARGIHWMAVLATVIVAAGFTVFAVDEMDGASQRQQAALGSTSPAPPDEPAPSRARSTIDDASAALLDPFAGLVESDNPWVERGVPTLLALLFYGAGLGFLARYVRSRT